MFKLLVVAEAAPGWPDQACTPCRPCSSSSPRKRPRRSRPKRSRCRPACYSPDCSPGRRLRCRRNSWPRSLRHLRRSRSGRQNLAGGDGRGRLRADQQLSGRSGRDVDAAADCGSERAAGGQERIAGGHPVQVQSGKRGHAVADRTDERAAQGVEPGLLPNDTVTLPE